MFIDPNNKKLILQTFLDTIFYQPLVTGEQIELRILNRSNKEVKQLFFDSASQVVETVSEEVIKENDCLFGVATRSGGAGKKNNAFRIFALWADIDDDSEEYMQVLKKLPIKPSIEVYSGHGRHLYWLLKEPINVKEVTAARIEGVLKGIAETVNGDTKVSDISHMMRLPGTINHKKAEPVDCGISSMDESLRYSFEELENAFPGNLSKKKSREGYNKQDIIPDIIPEGERNDTLTRMGGKLRYEGLTYEEIRAALLAFNEKRCKPPLEIAEVENIAKSVSKYKPGEIPIDVNLNPEDYGFRPLGMSGLNCVLYLSRRKEIVDVDSKKLRESTTLISLFGEENFYKLSKKFKNNLTNIANKIAGLCEKLGKYDSEKVRGPGVWEDEGKIIINSAKCLGTNEELSRIGNNYIYHFIKDIGEPSEKELTNQEAEYLYAYLKRWNWANPSDPLLLLGELGSSFLAGALQWRPHVWIVGSPGAGKSTLLKTIHKILGKYAIYVTDARNGSAAGIRQQLGSGARPIILDEAEADNHSDLRGSRIKEILTLMRSASSAAGIGTIKGTPDGKGMSFSVRAMFIVASINPPDFEPADQSRIAVLELDALQNTKASLPSLDDDIGAKLWTRIIRHYQTFYNYLNWVKEGLSELGNDLRFQDTYGTLIAAAFVALDPYMTKEQVQMKCKDINLKPQKQAMEEKNDFENMINVILNQIVDVSISGDFFAGERERRERMSLSEVVIRAAAARNNKENSYKKTLALYGMDVRCFDDTNFIEIFIPNNHVQIKGFFRGTKWENISWKRTLLREKDRATEDRHRIAGQQIRGVWVKTDIEKPYERTEKTEEYEVENYELPNMH